eukprot:TRINITY_DN3604_c0_g1_i2.p1 TRINITY_DN3604_c0_g1~~TRINITY_DN3604_c0_g1_i2.p1  ORF type:complete len:3176 (-),score=932.79 TRINITY_DN3604_c0_g1_i2:136-9663(-)
MTLTLNGGDQWDPAITNGNAAVNTLLAAITGDAGNPPGGWNTQVAPNLGPSHLARSSSTVVTITYGALPRYWIYQDETINITTPASTTTGAGGDLGSSTITDARCINSQEVWLTDNSWNMTDGPGAYLSNMQCRFKLTLSGAYSIALTFDELDTEEGWDGILISTNAFCDAPADFSGTPVPCTGAGSPVKTHEVDGTTSPGTLTIVGDTVYILFISDGSNEQQGFTISSAAAPGAVVTGSLLPSSTTAEVAGGGRTMIISLVGETWDASVTNGNAGADPLINAVAAAAVRTQADGWNEIMGATLDNTHLVRDSTTQVTITLPSTGFDPLIPDTFTDLSIPPSVLVTWPSAISSDISTLTLGDAAPGNAACTSGDANTVQWINGETKGYIQTGNPYADGANCKWQIAPGNVTAITIDFVAFATEAGFDYFYVYDNITGNLEDTYDSNTIPAKKTYSTSRLLLNFVSDGSTGDTGVIALFSVTKAVITFTTSKTPINTADISGTGFTLTLTLPSPFTWHVAVTNGGAKAMDVINAIKGTDIGSEAAGWETQVKPSLTSTSLTRASNTVVNINIPATAGYNPAIVPEVLSYFGQGILYDEPAYIIDDPAMSKDDFLTIVAGAPPPSPEFYVNGTWTAATLTEEDIRTGGSYYVLLYIVGDTWAAGVTNGAGANAIASSFSGSSGDPNSWNASASGVFTGANVYRVSDNLLNVTIPALPSYRLVTGDETITFNPALSTTTSGAPGTVTHTDGPKVISNVFATTFRSLAASTSPSENVPIVEVDLQTTGTILEWSVSGDEFVTGLTSVPATLTSCLGSVVSNKNEPNGWNNYLKGLVNTGHVALSAADTKFTITLPNAASFDITENEVVTLTLDGSCFQGSAASSAPSPSTQTFRIDGVLGTITGAGVDPICGVSGTACQCDGTYGTVVLSSAPTDMSAYSTGYTDVVFQFPLTGDNTAGQVFGTGPYTANSGLAQAAIHAGVLTHGVTGTVAVRVVAGLGSYSGSTANTYTSSASGASTAAYSFVSLGSCSTDWGTTNLLGEGGVINGSLSLSMVFNGATFDGDVLTDSSKFALLVNSFQAEAGSDTVATNSMTAFRAALSASDFSLDATNTTLTFNVPAIDGFVVTSTVIATVNIPKAIAVTADPATSFSFGRLGFRNDFVELGIGTVTKPTTPAKDHAAVGITLDLVLRGDTWGSDLLSNDANLTTLATSIFTSSWPDDRPNWKTAMQSGSITASDCTLSSDGRTLTIATGLLNNYQVPVREVVGLTSAMPSSLLTSRSGQGMRTTATTFTMDNTAVIYGIPSGPISEGGSITYVVTLRGPVRTNDLVTITNAAQNAHATISPSSFAFSAGNWSVGRTVTVTFTDDSAVDGGHDAILSHTPSSDQLASPSVLDNAAVLVTLPVPDNDAQVVPVSTLPTPPVTITEGDTAGFDYHIRLTATPDADVSVSLTTTEGNVILTPSSVVFASGSSASKTIKITAADNSVVTADRTDTVKATVTSTSSVWAAATLADLAIKVTEDDKPTVTLTPETITASQPEGGQVTYKVKISEDPIAPVTVTLSASKADQVTLSPTTHTFKTGEALEYTVTVDITQNTQVDGPRSVTISHAVTSASAIWAAMSIPDVSVPISDDDTGPSGIKVTGFPTGNVTMPENGTAIAFQAKVDPLPFFDANKPSFNMTMVFDVSPKSEGTVSPQAIQVPFPAAQVAATFTPAHDSIVDGDRDVTITVFLVAGGDVNTGKGGQTQATSVLKATVTDIDVPSVNITWTGSKTSEAGAQGPQPTVGLTLGTKPMGVITFPISISDTTEGSADVTEIKFTPTDYSVPHVVTFTGVDDTVADSLQPFNVTVGPATVANPLDATAYQGRQYTRQLLNMDDDGLTKGIQAYPQTGSISEDGTVFQEVSMSLSQQPSADVIMSISVSDPAKASVDTTTMTFTRDKWESDLQKVTIRALQDDGTVNSGNQTVKLIGRASGGLNSVMEIPFAVIDDDFYGVALTGVCATDEMGTPAPLIARLGSKITSAVKLDFSIAEVPADPSPSTTSKETVRAARIAPSKGTFGVGSANGAAPASNKTQQFTVTGVPLPDAYKSTSGVTYTMTGKISSNDANYASLPAITVSCTTSTVFFPEIIKIEPNVMSYLEPTNITLVGRSLVITQAQANIIGKPSIAGKLPSLLMNDRPQKVIGYRDNSPAAGQQEVIFGFEPILIPNTGSGNDKLRMLQSAGNVTTGTSTSAGNTTTTPATPAPASTAAPSTATTTTTANAVEPPSSPYDGFIRITVVNAQGGVLQQNPSDLYMAAKCLAEGETIGPDGSCQSCAGATGFKCLGGGRTEATEGFYIPPGGNAGDVAQCKPPNRCLGGGDSAGCSPGYTGDYCALCEPGWYLEGRLCRKCGTTFDRLLTLIWSLVTVVVLCIGFLITAIVTKDETFTDILDAIAAITLVQAVGRMSNPDLPQFMAAFYRNISVVMLDLDFLGEGIGCGPIPFTRKWLIHMAFVFCVFIPVSAIFAIVARVVKAWRRRNLADIETAYQSELWYQNRLVRVCLVIPVIVYVSVTTKLVQAINCQQVGPRSMLVADLTQECYKGDHTYIAAASWVMLIGYSVGLPLGLVAFLVFKRKKHYDPVFKARFGFFYEELKPNVFFYACAHLVVEFVIVICAEVLAEKPLHQFIIAAGLLGSLLLFVIIARPYRRHAENAVAASASIVGLSGVFLNYIAAEEIGVSSNTMVALAWVVFIMSIILVCGSLCLVFLAIQRGLRERRERKRYRQDLEELNTAHTRGSDDDSDIGFYKTKRDLIDDGDHVYGDQVVKFVPGQDDVEKFDSFAASDSEGAGDDDDDANNGLFRKSGATATSKAHKQPGRRPYIEQDHSDFVSTKPNTEDDGIQSPLISESDGANSRGKHLSRESHGSPLAKIKAMARRIHNAVSGDSRAGSALSDLSAVLEDLDSNDESGNDYARSMYQPPKPVNKESHRSVGSITSEDAHEMHTLLRTLSHKEDVGMSDVLQLGAEGQLEETEVDAALMALEQVEKERSTADMMTAVIDTADTADDDQALDELDKVIEELSLQEDRNSRGTNSKTSSDLEFQRTKTDTSEDSMARSYSDISPQKAKKPKHKDSLARSAVRNYTRNLDDAPDSGSSGTVNSNMYSKASLSAIELQARSGVIPSIPDDELSLPGTPDSGTRPRN